MVPKQIGFDFFGLLRKGQWHPSAEGFGDCAALTAVPENDASPDRVIGYGEALEVTHQSSVVGDAKQTHLTNAGGIFENDIIAYEAP